MNGHDYTARFEAPGGKPILHAYPDPLTGGEPWTIGLGHTGPDVKPDTVWTEDQCLHAYAQDYSVAMNVAAHVATTQCWTALNEARRAVLTDMAFNIGQARLYGFKKMLTALRINLWKVAANELLDSAYARQVNGRATTNAKVLIEGKLP